MRALSALLVAPVSKRGTGLGLLRAFPLASFSPGVGPSCLWHHVDQKRGCKRHFRWLCPLVTGPWQGPPNKGKEAPLASYSHALQGMFSAPAASSCASPQVQNTHRTNIMFWRELPVQASCSRFVDRRVSGFPVCIFLPLPCWTSGVGAVRRALVFLPVPFQPSLCPLSLLVPLRSIARRVAQEHPEALVRPCKVRPDCGGGHWESTLLR